MFYEFIRFKIIGAVAAETWRFAIVESVVIIVETAWCSLKEKGMGL